MRGAGNYHATKLKKFRQWLADASIEEEIKAMSEDDRKNVKFELERINARTGNLVSRINKLQTR